MSLFIKKQIKLYKGLKSCYCSALQKDVYFNSDGLNHILYYRRRPRKYSERHYRACLIKYLREVIENAKVTVQEIKSENPPVTTWSMEHKIADKNNFNGVVKVILLKKGNGNIYFLSVMGSKTKKPKP